MGIRQVCGDKLPRLLVLQFEHHFNLQGLDPFPFGDYPTHLDLIAKHKGGVRTIGRYSHVICPFAISEELHLLCIGNLDPLCMEIR